MKWHHFRAIMWVVVILIAVLLTPFAYIFEYSHAYIIDSASSASKSSAVMILGAGILGNGGMSPILMDRAQMALQLFKSGKVSKILISGGPSSDTTSEVDPIKAFMIKGGVPAADIITDPKGIDTYTSMYDAKNVFKLSSVIIVTQEFHLYRAIYLARSLGIDAYGVSANNGEYAVKNYVREFAADPKAMIDVWGKRVP